MHSQSKTLLYGIGGGNPRDSRMLDHYAAIAELAREACGRDRPRMLLLPTAHRNGTHPRLPFRKYMAACFEKQGCHTREILIGDVAQGDRQTPTTEITTLLEDADGLFVLGGDTRYLLAQLADRDLFPHFRRSFASGMLYSGSSAGLIWLATHSMSDSESFTSPTQWHFLMLQGLGVLPLTVNVHDDQGIPKGVVPRINRRAQFEAHLCEREDAIGLAVDEFVALEVRSGHCRVRSHRPDTGAYLLAKIEGTLFRRRIETSIDLLDKAALREYVKGP